MTKNIRISAINSSPKHNGHTSHLLNIFIDAAKKEGANVEKYDLYNEKIPIFSGILGRKITRLNHLQKALVKNDAFVIATPTYWFNTPGILKNFIDSLTPLEENGFMLEGKVAGFLVYSPECGETNVLESLALTFNQMGVAIPPYGLIFFRGPQDKWAIKDASLLAKSIVKEIEIQKQQIKSGAYKISA